MSATIDSQPIVGRRAVPAGCRSISRIGGFTLLEVLVALIVLSVGLLGLSGLQTTSLRNNHSAFLRSQATLLTHDIIDRMRANRGSAIDGNYNAVPSTSVSCTGICSPLQVAQMDVLNWVDYLERLPAGEGEIDVDGGNEIATVTVRWVDSRQVDANGDPVLTEIVTRVLL